MYICCHSVKKMSIIVFEFFVLITCAYVLGEVWGWKSAFTRDFHIDLESHTLQVVASGIILLCMVIFVIRMESLYERMRKKDSTQSGVEQ